MNAARKGRLHGFHHLKRKSKPGIGVGRNHHRTGCLFAVNGFFVFFAKHHDTGLTILDFMNVFRIGQECHFVGLGMA